MKFAPIKTAALLVATAIAAGCSAGGGGATDSAAAAKQATQATQAKVTIGTAEDSKGPAAAVEGAVSGGTVTVLEETDYAHLDPGQNCSSASSRPGERTPTAR